MATPYRAPPARRAHAAPSRFAFPTVRVRLAATRFELSALDADPGLFVGATLFALGGVFFALPWRYAIAGAIVLAAVVASARVALVVTPEGAWIEPRALGLRWSRAPLGSLPTIDTGIGWDWSELSIFPADPALRGPLQDGERAVLLQWRDHDAPRDADAVILARLAREEIERLHAR